jgi:ABC-2 type transport system permease protein
MELLMAQPVPRYRLLIAHGLVDLLTIPLLCLSLWAGTWLGTILVGPIQIHPLDTQLPLARGAIDPERLKIEVAAFGPALWNAGTLLFAVSGYTMWLSAQGRSRWRVLGLATFITLLQFLINLIGQLWEALAFLRPLTIFYYYQPQQIILNRVWTVNLDVWNGGQPLAHIPVLAVLGAVGALGYLMALWTFCRRDLPAPL